MKHDKIDIEPPFNLTQHENTSLNKTAWPSSFSANGFDQYKIHET